MATSDEIKAEMDALMERSRTEILSYDEGVRIVWLHDQFVKAWREEQRAKRTGVTRDPHSLKVGRPNAGEFALTAEMPNAARATYPIRRGPFAGRS